jgi:hypothetical protein
MTATSAVTGFVHQTPVLAGVAFFLLVLSKLGNRQSAGEIVRQPFVGYNVADVTPACAAGRRKWRI